MALVAIPGQGAVMGLAGSPFSIAPSLSSATVIDASTEKLAFFGRFFHKDHVSKDVTKIGFRTGAIALNAASTITTSLQNVNLAAGPPYQPDETQDEFITEAAATFASNTWHLTGALSANRTIAIGEMICVMFEYGTFTAADTFRISGLSQGATQVGQQFGTISKIAAAWGAEQVLPNVIFECSDGTFGTLAGTLPFVTINTHAFKQDTATTDEYALAFKLTFPCKIDAFSLPMIVAAGTSDFNVILHDGSTALMTLAVDANTMNGTAVRPAHFQFPPVTLAANTQYYASFQPSQITSTITVYTADVAVAGHLQAWPGGQDWNHSKRVDAGSFDAVTATRRLMAAIHMCHQDDGTGGGAGGMLVHPGMGGGFRG